MSQKKEKLKRQILKLDNLAWREAREKLDPTKNFDKRLKNLRDKQIAEIESQSKLMITALNHGGVKDVENCLVWAFGKDYKSVSEVIDLIGRWNQKHGRKVFPIYPEHGLVETFTRIGRAYKKRVIDPYIKHMALIGKPVVY